MTQASDFMDSGIRRNDGNVFEEFFVILAQARIQAVQDVYGSHWNDDNDPGQ